MLEFAGALVASYGRPYVYFILKDGFLYIGETLNHPAIRLGSHLLRGGSFYEALLKRDEDALQSQSRIMFIAFECSQISELDEIDRKPVIRYVEHKLHLLVLRNRFRAGLELQLISSTERTAPSRCKYKWADDVADTMMEAFLEQLQQKAGTIRTIRN